MICAHCDGKGYVVVCIDDLCHGGDECIHGDGEVACLACQGSGYGPLDDYVEEDDFRGRP